MPSQDFFIGKVVPGAVAVLGLIVLFALHWEASFVLEGLIGL